MSKILLIDDDLELADALKQWFVASGHVFEHAGNGEDGLQMLRNFQFDIIVLDWNLPGVNGIEVCQEYRRPGGKTPIIFLTGQGHIENIETGLDVGADDYLVKPFNVRELSARIRTIQRRPPSLLPQDLSINNLVLDPVKHVVTVDGVPCQLTPKESGLLAFLLRNPNRPCQSQTLVDAVWPSDGSGTAEAVRTWMKNLRRKLEAAGVTGLIKTVPGVGYIIERSD